MRQFRRTVIRIWLLHLAASVALFAWALVATLGLGFKDRSTWTAFDGFQATVAPLLASIVTLPGRWVGAVTNNGYVACGAMVLNSLLWAVALAAILSAVKHRATRQ